MSIVEIPPRRLIRNGHYQESLAASLDLFQKETLSIEQIEIENMMFGLRTDGFDITDSNISPKKLQENIEK